jgi:hypothetical protein
MDWINYYIVVKHNGMAPIKIFIISFTNLQQHVSAFKGHLQAVYEGV